MHQETETSGSTAPRSSRARRVLRWGLLGVILGMSAAAWTWIWLVANLMRQEQVVNSVLTGILTAVLLLLWLLLCSGFRWRVRFALLGLVGLVAIGLAASVRVRGFSGDIVPILSWRWVAEPAETPASTAGAEAAAPTGTVALAGLDDFPQFRGPQRDAMLPPLALERDWSARPPRALWRQPIGVGWSGFAVVGRRAVTQEQDGEDELVVCYDVATGQVLWTHRDRARYDSTLAGPGPRSTPTVVDGGVFTLGATGLLNALSLDDGSLRWSVDILADNSAKPNEWGMSGSPLVTAQHVVINAGGPSGRSLVAYDRESGQRAWTAGDDGASYASPQLLTLAGVAQIVMVNGASVTGHDPERGRILWEQPWPGRNPKVAQPIALSPDSLMVSAGYALGSLAVRLQQDDDGNLQPNVVWRSRSMKAKFTNIVLHDGFVYGLDDGVLACIDASDGRRRWKSGRYGHGQLVLVGDLLLLQAEDGAVCLIEATPEEHREITRFAALDGKSWNTPALAGRFLLVRNDVEAACYELPLAESAMP